MASSFSPIPTLMAEASIRNGCIPSTSQRESYGARLPTRTIAYRSTRGRVILIAPEAAAFQEPWEAQAFALAITLHARGAFTWAEWSARLAATIQNAPRSPYYDCWLQALEQLVKEKRLV